MAAEIEAVPETPVPTQATHETIPAEAPVTAPGVQPERQQTQVPVAPSPLPTEKPAPLPPGLAQSLSRAQAIMDRPAINWPEESRSEEVTPDFYQGIQVTDAMTRSEDPYMRQRALESIQAIDPTQLLPAWNALRDPNPENRMLAIEYLRQAPAESLAKLLLEHLNGPEGAQWTTVLEEPLASLRSTMEPYMIAVLQGGDRPLIEQRIALWSLGRMGSLAALPLLSEGAWSLEPALVEESVYALEALRNTTTVPVWAKLTQHEHYAVRQIAVKNLNTLGGPESFDALAALALGATPIDPILQQDVVRGLTQWPPEETVPLLLQVMHQNPNVRRLVGAYFRQLTGATLPDMAPQWEVYFYGSSESVPGYNDTPQPGLTGNDLLDNVPFVPPGFQPG